jgi:hypothetical protein
VPHWGGSGARGFAEAERVAAWMARMQAGQSMIMFNVPGEQLLLGVCFWLRQSVSLIRSSAHVGGGPGGAGRAVRYVN